VAGCLLVLTLLCLLVVCRFDLQVVPNVAAKPKHGVDLLPAPKKGDQQQGKVRSCTY
jgi:hypothetical protein